MVSDSWEKGLESGRAGTGTRRDAADIEEVDSESVQVPCSARSPCRSQRYRRTWIDLGLVFGYKERPHCRERVGRLWIVVCCDVELQSRCCQDPSRFFRSDLLAFLSCVCLLVRVSVSSVPCGSVYLPVLFSHATQLARPTTSHSPASKGNCSTIFSRVVCGVCAWVSIPGPGVVFSWGLLHIAGAPPGARTPKRGEDKAAGGAPLSG